jgi:hypothetical protein
VREEYELTVSAWPEPLSAKSGGVRDGVEAIAFSITETPANCATKNHFNPTDQHSPSNARGTFVALQSGNTVK